MSINWTFTVFTVAYFGEYHCEFGNLANAFLGRMLDYCYIYICSLTELLCKKTVFCMYVICFQLLIELELREELGQVYLFTSA